MRISLSGNTTDAEYLQGLTEKVQSGDMLTPRQYVRKYGGAARLINNNEDINHGLLFGPEYNLLDRIRYMRGVSYVQEILIGLPVYFIMGQYDYMTSAKAAKTYFVQIDASEKEFITYDQSAHYPQFEEKEKFSKWMVDSFAK